MAGIPQEVPSTSVNMLCGSGLRAVVFAYQAIRCGDARVVVAGGQESMSQVGGERREERREGGERREERRGRRGEEGGRRGEKGGRRGEKGVKEGRGWRRRGREGGRKRERKEGREGRRLHHSTYWARLIVDFLVQFPSILFISLHQSPHCVHMRAGTKFGDASLTDTMMKDGLLDAFHNYHMGITAENVARQHGIGRQQQDEFAAASQNRTEVAQKAGLFVKEIIPVTIQSRKGELIPNTVNLHSDVYL